TDEVGTQIAGWDLHVEVADRLVRLRTNRNSADGEDLRFHVRTIIQVHHGQAEVGTVNHGLIESLQQDNERIAGRFGHHAHGGCEQSYERPRPADQSSSSWYVGRFLCAA